MEEQYTHVIYNKKTGQVLVLEMDGKWMIPHGYGLAEFRNGVQPALVEQSKGEVYFKPNALIVTDI